MEKTSTDLFNLLVSKDFTVKTLDSSGKEQSNLEEVEMFSFDFEANDKNFGTVVILLNSEGQLELFYGDNIGKSMEREDKKVWTDLLYQLRMFAKRNMMGFQIQNINRLKYSMQSMASVNESFKHIFEGYYGTKKTSYNPQGNAKIIIKHSKNIGEDDKRYRNVKSIFIQNEDGERFRLPFKKLVGARAMARHVTEGGNPYDIFGLHISEMVNDIGTLGGFMRRSKIFAEADGTAELVETGRTHYNGMRKSLKSLASKRGYRTYKEGWSPEAITEVETDVESIRKLFTSEAINAKVDEALPLLAKLSASQPDVVLDDVIPVPVEDTRMQEVNEFEDWANKLVEGTWSVPQNDHDIRALQEFFAVEQPAGIDAMDATNKLYDILGDDNLFDNLSKFAEDNPEGDTRPLVKSWLINFIKYDADEKNAAFLKANLSKLGLDSNMPPVTEERDLDSDEQCSSHDDDDKITNKGNGMDTFSDYAEEKEIPATQEPITESQKDPVISQLEEETDLTALMQRTNHLLHK